MIREHSEKDTNFTLATYRDGIMYVLQTLVAVKFRKLVIP